MAAPVPGEPPAHCWQCVPEQCGLHPCPDCHFWVDVRDKCSGDGHCAACAVVAGPRFMCDVAIRDGLAVPNVPVAGHRPPAVS